jgi:GNAT superfamily N-acetyltransferase
MAQRLMKPTENVTVRRLSSDPATESGSWAAVRELCCRTGDNGAPIARERWAFFARIWIDPYEKLVPHWTYVAENGADIVGYLTGCPDSMTFYRRRRWQITLPTVIAILFGRYRPPGAGAYVRRALGMVKSAEQCFSSELLLTLIHDYPAHLHINVDAGHRRAGVGRQLMERYFADLRRANVEGVHLFCGTEPVAFYRRLGFQVLGSVKYGGAPVFALGRRG